MFTSWVDDEIDKNLLFYDTGKEKYLKSHLSLCFLPNRFLLQSRIVIFVFL